MLTRMNNHRLSVSIFPADDHFAIGHRVSAFNIFPDVGTDRCQGEVAAQVNFCTVGREDFTLEFVANNGFGQRRIGCIHTALTGIIFLAVEDSGMLHRTRNAGFPMLSVGAKAFLGAINIGQFQYTTEGTLLANHSVIAARSHYLVGPPPWRHLCRQHILGTSSGIKFTCNVIGERTLGLHRMGETRLEHFLTDILTVDIDFIHTEACRHPHSLGHLLFVLQRGDEPVGAIGCTGSILDFSCHNRGIGNSNP